MLTIQCPNPGCGKSYRLGDAKFGQRVKCRCGNTFAITKDSIQTEADRSDTGRMGAASVETTPPPVPGQPREASSKRTDKTSIETPHTIDRFEILSRLGEGAFGIVYRARDPLMDREVALKLPQSATFQSEEALARFVREAQTAGRLAHPNIVTVYEVAVDERQIYIASAFIEGKTLDVVIKRGDMDCRQAVDIVHRLADALDYAHRQGITHRDIKPANVILDNDGQPHLLDFGLAKLQDERQKLSQAGSIMGTPAYMSPEQARGGKKQPVGPASDQYSLGVLLYELLTGRVPFTDDDFRALMLQVIHNEPPSPRSVSKEIPADLETICLKVMSKEPAGRYASCAELNADLQRWQNDLPIQARRIGPVERFKRWCKRNPLVAGLTAAVFLVFAIGFATSSVFAVQANERAEAERQAKEAETIAKNNASDANKKLEAALKNVNQQVYISKVALAGVKWNAGSMNGFTELVDSCPHQHRNWEWHYLRYATHDDLPTLKGHTKHVQSVSYSPDGKWIVSGSGDNTIKIWDANTDRLIRTLRGHADAVSSVAFSPDSTRIVSGSWGDDATVRIWDVKTGRVLRKLNGHKSFVKSVAFSPNGKRVVSGGHRFVKIWNAETGEAIRTLRANAVDCVAISPDGKRIASDDWDADALLNTVKIWDAETGRVLRSLRHLAKAKTVAFSPDGKRIVSGSEDDTVKIWNVETGRELRTLKGHVDDVSSVAFSPDGKWIVSGSEDKTIKLWNVESGRELRTLKGHRESVNTVAFSPDGKRIVSGSDDGTVKIWDAPIGRVFHTLDVRTLKGNPAWVNSVAFSPDGKRFVIGDGGRANSVTICDSATGRVVLQTLKETGRTESVAFSPDGKWIVSSNGRNLLRIWNAQTGKILRTLNGRAQYVSFNPDGKRLVSGGDDDTVKIWDVETGREFHTLKGHGDDVESVAFSPDGKWIVSGSRDETVKIWSAETGRELRTLKGHRESVTSVAFSPDGRIIASGGYDKTVRIWDAVTGQQLRVLKGHLGRAYCVAFSPDGKRIISGSGDRTLRVWETASGSELLTLKGHTSIVNCVSVSLDGRRIVSGSNDGSIRIYDAGPGFKLPVKTAK